MSVSNLFSAWNGSMLGRKKTRPTNNYAIPSASTFNADVSGRREEEGDKTYTIDDAIEKLGFGPFQFKLALICGFVLVAPYSILYLCIMDGLYKVILFSERRCYGNHVVEHSGTSTGL